MGLASMSKTSFSLLLIESILLLTPRRTDCSGVGVLFVLFCFSGAWLRGSVAPAIVQAPGCNAEVLLRYSFWKMLTPITSVYIFVYPTIF